MSLCSCLFGTNLPCDSREYILENFRILNFFSKGGRPNWTRLGIGNGIVISEHSSNRLYGRGHSIFNPVYPLVFSRLGPSVHPTISYRVADFSVIKFEFFSQGKYLCFTFGEIRDTFLSRWIPGRGNVVDLLSTIRAFYFESTVPRRWLAAEIDIKKCRSQRD